MKKMREEWKGAEVIRRLAENRRAPGGVFRQAEERGETQPDWTGGEKNT